ncbi:MAG: hypothetical protein ACD_81C00100G0006 [uncultured bacterium]|uniref:Peptidoglycan binding-like domain-containing protein n=1 Tax=Candidatus Wolfebacteria bacterium GW2011_GWE2_44_13 TaxID=1619017 RepID=A0A0G1K555_9BACT|nr:MAG: hypothetical protein ACD_81C00100G0006 [uncultured bacterium]KKT42984.1 MAG: hypothetical protein UW32_C0003G0087 [Candidatus Wolfebacteria bacterium GW2011_GWE2_44_13]
MNIKRNIVTILVVGIIFGNAFVASAQTTTTASTTTATLQSLIQTLQKQIESLTVQLQTLQKAQAQPQTATNTVGMTDVLQLIEQLKEGSSGEKVRTLQTILAADINIYPEGIITGYYGKLTARAVRRFQSLEQSRNIAKSSEKILAESPVQLSGKVQNTTQDRSSREEAYRKLIDEQNRVDGEKIQADLLRRNQESAEADRKRIEEERIHAEEERLKEQRDTYTEHEQYPIILSLEDSKGNTYKTSMYNQYKGPYISWPSEGSRILRVGDTFKATVIAKDPQGRGIEYNWESNSRPFMDSVSLENNRLKYVSNNTLEYKITEEDLKSVGETFRLVWHIRAISAGYYRFGGGQYDDSGYIDYKIVQ